MEHRPGEQPLAAELEFIAVPVESAHHGNIRPHDVALLIGEREAAFHAALLPGCFDYLGINRLDELIALLAAVDHNDAAKHPDLWRGKAHAFRLIHGFSHIVKQLMQLLVEYLYGFRRLIKAGRAACLYLSYSH